MSERVLVPYKGIFESKLVWVSIIQTAVGVLVGFGLIVPNDWPQERIETVAGALFTVAGLGVGFLRVFKTSQPLEFHGKLPAEPEKKI